MKIATISKKLIKPLTPTPPNLKNYYLSFTDQNSTSQKFGVVLFYESKPMQLEQSLAKILVQFYPLAGRYINDHLINCSDEGALFVEAEALEVVELKNMENHNLFPHQDSPSDPLLSIQVTHLPSGGVAIAIAVSHKVFDGSSLGTFIAAWSNATTNPDGKIDFTPSFDLPSLLPANTDSDKVALTSEDKNDLVVKRFLFDKAALTRLRSKLSQNRNGKTISRVRVVSAVMAKALIGLDQAKHGKTRDFVMMHAINLRERTTTPQPKHACGNMVVPSLTGALQGKEIELQELVDLIGDAIEKTIADHAEILCSHRDGRDIITNTWDNVMRSISNPDTNLITFSDWSKLGFYEADFGWGKPVCVSIKPIHWPNTTFLLSNKDGDGIEAWVYLNKDNMHYFDQDQDINSFSI